MALSNVLSRSRDIKNKDVPQSLYENVRVKGQTTYDQVQHSVRSGWRKVQALVALIIGGILFKQSQNNAQKEWKNQQKRMKQQQQKIKKEAARNLSKAQAALMAGMVAAQKILEDNTQKAQQNLTTMQNTLQQKLSSGVNKTQETLNRSSQRASENWTSMMSKANEKREEAARLRLEKEHKRDRARMLFRWGLVVGVTLAILYAPYPGSEARHRLNMQFQRIRGYMNQ